MPFKPITAEKLSDAVVRQIEQLILRGVLRPAERLPPERELAERLGVSRPSLRDAIARLQQDGLLDTRAGAGVYVAEVLGHAFSPALVALFGRHDEAVFDYLSFRRDMEGLAAERAAKLGTDTDLAVINALFAKMQQAQASASPDQNAQLDAQFHMAIIEASHNVVMLHMMRSMYALLQGGVFYNRQVMFDQRTSAAALLDQHRAINDALQARDPAGARTAVEAHLTYVHTALEGQRRRQQNEAIAQQRLDHEQER